MEERVDLARLLEGVAVVMGLDAGHQRVELIFANGRLRQWWTHSEKRSPRELAELDADAAIHAAAVRYGQCKTRHRQPVEQHEQGAGRSPPLPAICPRYGRAATRVRCARAAAAPTL
jgi:hypothetical protein